MWLPAVGKAGQTGVHFHDLRHAGNHYTASAGANLRELMERMGHSTSRAAMIYLHSTDPRQRTLADAVDKAARDELRQAKVATHDQEPSSGQRRIWHGSGTRPRARLMKITSVWSETGPDLRWNVSAPSATRTRDLLLRRHNRPSAVQTSNDARHQRAKKLKAVAPGTTFAGSLLHGRGPVDFSRMAAISSAGCR